MTAQGWKRAIVLSGLNWLAPVGSVSIFFLVVVVAILASFIAPYPPTEGSLSSSLMPPFWADGGAWSHPLGTDSFGRDILSRLIHGARISLTVSCLAIFLSGGLGTALGVIAGYFGGKVDAVLMRLTDIGLSMPLILMAIVLAAALRPSFVNVILVIVLLLWPRYARQVRGETLTIKNRDFVAAAKVVGCSPIWIIWRHILPNLMPTLLVLATLQLGYVILLEASLSFLGVGIPSPQPSWGVMVADGRGLIASAWWISLWPGLAIMLLVLSGNIFGDWLRDRLDPRLRQV